MNSSTSPSDKKGVALILAFLIALPGAWIYTFKSNREVLFWKAAFDSKREWAVSQRQPGRPLTIFSGGSTAAFQIDSGLLLREFDAITVNAGFHAGMGLDGTVALATSFLKNGDRLVLMTEPSILATGGGRMTSLGSQMVMATGCREDSFFQSSLADTSAPGFLLQCRPGLYHSATMLGKLVARRPSYRYTTDDLRPGGLISTPIREEISSPATPVPALHLSPAGERFLRELKSWTGERSIELIYLLPVSYSPPDQLDRQRTVNRDFLDEVSRIIPVWNDSYTGAWAGRSDFADTPLHMISTAAEARTRDLGKIYFSR